MSAADDDQLAEDIADEEEHLEEGTLLSHLLELRNRLLWAFGAVIIVFLALLPFSKTLLEVASEPVRQALPAGASMIAIDPVSKFFVPLKLAFFVAIFIAVPVILYQTWAFIAPGLYRKEKRFAIPLLASSITLFYLGVTFCYFVVMPLIFNFVIGNDWEAVASMPDIASYVSFILPLFLAFGVAFEVPVATVLLCWAGITTPEKLASVRAYVFLGCFVVGMFLTPPDVFSQTLLAIPVYLLFELGILFSRSMLKNRSKRDEEDAAAT
ncbi:MAG: twin-arginine translocase subunit TatC [Pseudomonadota bacterium]